MILGEKLKINKRKCKFVLRRIVAVQWIKTIPPYRSSNAFSKYFGLAISSKDMKI